MKHGVGLLLLLSLLALFSIHARPIEVLSDGPLSLRESQPSTSSSASSVLANSRGEEQHSRSRTKHEQHAAQAGSDHVDDSSIPAAVSASPRGDVLTAAHGQKGAVLQLGISSISSSSSPGAHGVRSNRQGRKDGTSWAAISSSSGDAISGSSSWLVRNSTHAVLASRRHLQQSVLCPEGCAPGFCVAAGVDPAAGFKCQQCLNNLMVDKATGKCACPAGRYSQNANSCSDCRKGSYCNGGVYKAGTPENEPKMTACGIQMTTLGLRSTSIRACVNLPGTYYTINGLAGIVGAVTCPVDTHGPGLRKQRACVPCPPNYVTNGKTGQTSPMQCIIPPGFYLKAPGVIAPCPMGEWKDGTGPAGNCTKCFLGVTTANEASASAAACAVLLPGYYAAAVAATGEIRSTSICPQKYWCGGGAAAAVFEPLNPVPDQSIQACPFGTWTQERGAVSPEQCLTPPGHFTSGGVTAICPDGSFRPDWLPASQATACTSCGEGVQGDKSDRITVWNMTTGASSLLPVMTTAGDCFVQAGQGLFYSSLTDTFRARNCDAAEYGVPTRFYGLTPYPCRSCPSGLVTSNSSSSYPNSAAWWVSNGDGTQGFTSERACVTPPGWGYSSRIANPCPISSYNPRDSYGPCQMCPAGRTTAAVGAGATLADCGIAQGYGFHDGAVTQCLLGTFNDAPYRAGTTTPCTACPNDKTTTAAVGSDAASDCNLCKPGYGGAGCSTACGGVGALATYGPAGRPLDADCAACVASATGYSFIVGVDNDVFAPLPLSPTAATSAVQCFTQYAQMSDAWWLPTAGNTAMTVIASITSFSACVDECTNVATCQYLTYDYDADTCYVRTAQTNGIAGTPWVGFKAVPSSDVEHSWSLSNRTSIKTASSGQYTWWLDSNFDSIGTQTAPANVNSFTTLQDCLDACDDAGAVCAGVRLRPSSTPSLTPRNCLLIKGDMTLGVNKRSMTRADVTRMALPPIV